MQEKSEFPACFLFFPLSPACTICRGEVLLTSPLDREMDATFKFQVTAFDGYYYSFPAATVDVIVIDVNDNEPLFDNTYRFTISGECRRQASYVVSY